MKKINNLDKIFKAYDIRGVYPKEINKSVAYKIGQAVVEFLTAKKIVVGRDIRPSSKSLFKELVRGIRDRGIDVIDIGLVTTPMMYFGVINLKADGGVMITASHNPPEYNGFKIVRKKSVPISEDSGLLEIKKIVCQGKVFEGRTSNIFRKDILNDYIENALKFADVKRIKPFKVVVDTGNAMGGIVAPEFFKRLPCKAIPLYWELDGTFPNHTPDPLRPENTKNLQKRVLKEKADLGIALDGDVDRVFFIDEKGERISADFITALLSRVFLKENPRAKILYDLRSSWIVKEEIQRYGGTPIIYRVGHSLIKKKMKDSDILFGGELSGHYYLKNNYFLDSPFIVILKILELISEEGEPISEIIRPLKRYFSSGEINFTLPAGRQEVKDKEKTLKELEREFSDAKHISYLDGLSIEYSNWWFNIRPSHTEPLLRLNIEAKNKELLEEKRKKLTKLIK